MAHSKSQQGQPATRPKQPANGQLQMADSRSASAYLFETDAAKSSVTVRDSPGPLRFDSPVKPTQPRLTGDRTLKVRKTTFDPVRDPELYALWAR